MTGEVIDLLSSSPSGPVLAPAQTQQSARPLQPRAPSQPLAYDGDNVFDLTASSPLPVPEALPVADTVIPDSSQQLPPPPKLPSGGAVRGVFFQSDDFDTTGDLDKSIEWDGPLRVGAGNGKRRRLSPSVDAEASQSSTSRPPAPRSKPPVAQTPVVKHTQERHAHRLAEPINLSSSPQLGLNLPTSAQPRKVNEIMEVGSPDPFKSTPPPPPPPQNPSALPPLIRPTDDPFDSDPPHARARQEQPSSVIDLNVDDVDDNPFKSSSPPPAKRTKPSAEARTAQVSGNKPKSPKRPVAWDPISSSAPEIGHSLASPKNTSKTKGKQSADVIDLDLEDDSDEPRPRKAPNAGSDDDFPDVGTLLTFKPDPRRPPARRPISRSPPPPSARSAARAMARSTSLTTTSKTSNKAKSAEEKARDKERKAVEREMERERKQREKEAAKAQKARDKERAAAMAEVNKVRTDKKVSTPEMIVDLSSSLPTALALQAQELLKDLDVETSTWQSPVDNIIKWRRKVKSVFNDDIGMWEPIPLRVEDESYALAVVTADQFIEYALGPEGANLEHHVREARRHFPTQQMIYLIEGLTPWMRKNRNLRNRQFTSAVRSQPAGGGGENPESGAPSTSRKRKQPASAPREYVDEDTIEDALIELQVVHGMQIHHTTAAVETAQWVAVFTQHISTVPYRKQKEAANAAGAGFCMESGQVRTGDGVRDTYTKMLQEIVRVTAPIAYGVAGEFGSVTKLVAGMEQRGPLAVESCKKSANKDGAATDRTIGQAVSRRLHKVFTGRDETSTDV